MAMRSPSLMTMADVLAGVRLLGPPETDGEYIVLNQHETMHLHEYSRIYAVPGLYEYVVQERLRCRSPQVAVEGFLRVVADPAPSALAVLDFGAGTGLVGELMRRAGIAKVVGVDSLPAARMACTRDRPGIYTDYLVGDFSHDGALRAALRSYSLGGLISAGAFGGTHAMPEALNSALSVLPPGAPVSVTIDERWMDESDPNGFGATIGRLAAGGDLVVMERSRFQHRVTTTGEPIFYQLVVARTGAG
jgi:SAM-dependent methyltransferase